jgi:hypothetical protein
VSEHLCQGDWEAKFQQGNSSLWKSGLGFLDIMFSDFSAKRGKPHAWYIQDEQPTSVVRTVRIDDLAVCTVRTIDAIVCTNDVNKTYNLLALCNLPKAKEAITEVTSKPLRVKDLALQDSERDLSV